jgi:hypothetical protein
MEQGIEKYLGTYKGKQLVVEHGLQEKGVWEIRGEDPNCDLGGPHIQPKLEVVEGRLIDVIAYGVELPGFWQWGGGGWQWGGGGEFRKVDTEWKQITQLDSGYRRQLKRERKEITERLEEINQQLEG